MEWISGGHLVQRVLAAELTGVANSSKFTASLTTFSYFSWKHQVSRVKWLEFSVFIKKVKLSFSQV